MIICFRIKDGFMIISETNNLYDHVEIGFGLVLNKYFHWITPAKRKLDTSGL
jgi:hypothetical protein